MIIRKLTAEDLPAFRDLRIEMCAAHPEAFEQTSDEAAATSDQQLLQWMLPQDVFPEKFILAGLQDNEILGVVGFQRDEHSKLRHRALIWSVYVRPQERGRGICRNLMLQTIEAARTMEGLEFLTLEVSSTQTSAKALYVSLGFKTIGNVWRCYKLSDSSYVDSEDMVLKL